MTLYQTTLVCVWGGRGVVVVFSPLAYTNLQQRNDINEVQQILDWGLGMCLLYLQPSISKESAEPGNNITNSPTKESFKSLDLSCVQNVSLYFTDVLQMLQFLAQRHRIA